MPASLIGAVPGATLQVKLPRQATIAAFGVVRALVFTAGGLMLAAPLMGVAILIPFALAGLCFGNRIHLRESREWLLRFASALLLLIGVSLIARVIAG